MNIFQTKSNNRLKMSLSSAKLSLLGLITHANSGSRAVNGGDLRFFSAETHCIIFAGLREPSCESTRGTTVCVLSTPSQARFFCARDKAQERHSINGLQTGDQRRCQCITTPFFRTIRRKSKPKSHTICGMRFICHGLWHCGPPENIRTGNSASRRCSSVSCWEASSILPISSQKRQRKNDTDSSSAVKQNGL